MASEKATQVLGFFFFASSNNDCLKCGSSRLPFSYKISISTIKKVRKCKNRKLISTSIGYIFSVVGYISKHLLSPFQSCLGI